MIHLYGVMIGLGIVIGLWLVEIPLKKNKASLDDFYKLFWLSLIGGLIGARGWHVMTDFSYYQHQWGDVFKVWNGGMSIIGGVLGGVLTAWLIIKFFDLGKKINFKLTLDALVFGLPVAQAIGRWGNYFNQELYGQPTQLPWGIYIDPAHRLIGYEQFSHFHPLFLYEMGLMLLFAGGVWMNQRRQFVSGFSIGSGKLFYLYIFYYSFIRFWLDFIRIDKTQFIDTNLGINQFFLIFIMLGSGYWLSKKR